MQTGLTTFHRVCFCFFQTSNARHFYHSTSCSIGLRVMQFSMEVYLDNTRVDLEGQDHKVINTCFFLEFYRGHLSSWRFKVKVKAHKGQGQRSCLYMYGPPSTFACKCDVHRIFWSWVYNLLLFIHFNTDCSRL